MPPAKRRHIAHRAPTLLVFGEGEPLPLPPPGIRPKNIPTAMSVTDLLAEPNPRDGQWGAACLRRCIAVSTGPVACSVHSDSYRRRLETAGWFVADPEADFPNAAEACWPALPSLARLALGVGSPRPALVFVGDASTHADQLPFESRSGTWLFLALRAMGYDELSCYFVNGLDHLRRRRTKRIAELGKAFNADSNPPTWVSLSDGAAEVLTAAKIPHVRGMSPAAHKRFAYAEGPAGLGAKLTALGIPPGPWADEQIPTASVKKLEPLPWPYNATSMHFRPPGGVAKLRGRDRAIDPVKRESARRMFITGEAPTLSAAAEAVGVDMTKLRQHAKHNGWAAEREEHLLNVTERVKERAAAAEGKAMANARRMSCALVEGGLVSLLRRLKDKSLIPTPGQVESFSRVWITLSSAVVLETQEEAAAKAIPLREQARMVLEQIERGLGGA